jgi:hypothetical protein
MRRLLKESDIERVVYSYLDSQDYEVIVKVVAPYFGKIKTPVYYLTIDPSSGYADMVYESWMETLFVTTELCEEIKNYFGFEDTFDALLVISDWVSNKIGKKIEQEKTFRKYSPIGENTFALNTE